jgi:hypothetical protein
LPFTTLPAGVNVPLNVVSVPENPAEISTVVPLSATSLVVTELTALNATLDIVGNAPALNQLLTAVKVKSSLLTLTFKRLV